ncbi:hypothetical protein GCM10014715_79780 [Streptomyces spiralis]|uniref:Uncharacterized protein n=1 Tax=Streptomyces spiralis TaxID=66376 RepID=A0A919E467_9ACTN|nr:hypothetical protein GCM10014715_79780 [Streptomyces spiralis]
MQHAPYGAYTCADGKEVLLSVQTEREWATLCARFLDAPGLVDDPRFATGSACVSHREELNAIVAERFAETDSAEAMRLLDEAAIANAGVNDIRGLSRPPGARRTWPLAGRADSWWPGGAGPASPDRPGGRDTPYGRRARRGRAHRASSHRIGVRPRRDPGPTSRPRPLSRPDFQERQIMSTLDTLSEDERFTVRTVHDFVERRSNPPSGSWNTPTPTPKP